MRPALNDSWRASAGPREAAERPATTPPHMPAQCTPPMRPAANAAAANAPFMIASAPSPRSSPLQQAGERAARRAERPEEKEAHAVGAEAAQLERRSEEVQVVGIDQREHDADGGDRHHEGRP